MAVAMWPAAVDTRESVGTSSMIEQWRDIEGFEGRYQVSNQGRVRSVTREVVDSKCRRIFKGKILRPGVQSNNYLGVHLYDKAKSTSRLVHHLVAEAFIGPRPEGQDIDHIDRDRTNNTAANLRYLSIKENRGQSNKPGKWRVPRRRGKAPKLTVEQVRMIRKARVNGENLRQIARDLGVSNSAVAHAAQGRSWGNVE